MSIWSNCQNCGAVIYQTADSCAYCGTPYPIRLWPELQEIRMNEEILAALNQGIMSLNEARRRLGMRQIHEDEKEITV